MSVEVPLAEHWTRPLPQPSELTRPFWDGCREQRLLIQRCQTCLGYVFIPQAFCPKCLGSSLDWVQAAGTGSVVTFTVVWRPQTPAFEVPYVIAVVQLDEGVDLLTNLIEVEPGAVSIGMRVTVRFVSAGPDLALPFFTPIAGSSGQRP
jgi:uncharacterized OB-fold protein